MEIVVTGKKLTDPAAFYTKVKELTKSLNAVQIETVDWLLAHCHSWCIGHLAYGLATAWHEARFTPQPEWGRGKGHPYAQPGARSNHQIGPIYCGQPPYGRGLVQLTWVDNYEWADLVCDEAGLTKSGDILKNFNLVMDPEIASYILARGMTDGSFCGNKAGERFSLSRYITGRGTHAEFVLGRHIINGTDRAEDIADYADHFILCLDAGGW